MTSAFVAEDAETVILVGILRLERRRKGIVAAFTRLGASEGTASVVGFAVPAPSPLR